MTKVRHLRHRTIDEFGESGDEVVKQRRRRDPGSKAVNISS
jgi:hypothetical protein